MGQSRKTEYYLDLRTDYGFKRVFGENPDILKSLLNEFLHEVIGRKITDVVYLQTEVLGFSNKEKRIIFDLYCEDQIMNRMIVEMQRAEQEYYESRMLYYMGRSISKSVKRGDLKYWMQKIISLHLLDYKSVWFNNSDELVRTIQLQDDKNKIFSEKVAIVLVNLCNFASRKKTIEFPSLRHKWAYLLKNMQKMTLKDEAKETDPIFKRLYEESRLSNLNEEEMEEYKKSVLEYQDVQDAIECACKRSEARGMARGEARGEARGIKAGIAEGIVRGEANAKRAIIAQMLENGLSIPVIIKLTGLSEDEVQSLS